MPSCAARFAFLAASAALLLAPSGASAQPTVVKPYFMVIVDNSGSMATGTGGGNNSCGFPHNRISDARCVLTQVVNGYGDVTFGLERFRETCSGTCNASCGTSCGCSCSWLNCSGCGNSGSGCPATGANADQGQVLVPIADENQNDILAWVNSTCNTCTLNSALNPELESDTWTPIAGSLRGARRYFEGGDPVWTPSPIATDSYRGCRPYNVILLTDGEETCASDAQTLAAATELRTTTFGGFTYDIHTFVIGFGMTGPDTNIEAIATAGGTDAPGTNRGFYATDETTLALAFSQIIADSILIEVCDGIDNNCNTLIDEGFTKYCNRPAGITTPTLCTDPGETVCNGVDDNCNGFIDEGLLNACGTCGPAPTEVCDGIDNDCDGIIDEGGVCSGCIPSAEICDNIDNDCDGTVDNITRTCGTDVGVCTAGTQLCTAGIWGTCSGIGPGPEVCDGLDNDCDGLTDGISRPCGTDVGECQAGTQVCTASAWGTCTGAIGPTGEICDGRDNDCDGSTDELNPGGGGSCGSMIGACRPGTLTCLGGALVCTGGVSPIAETCNGADDDCDGATDEGIASPGPCGSSVGECRQGALQCVGGAFTCVGGRGSVPEICNLRDDDCDGTSDEGNPGGGAACGTDVGECVAGTTQCLAGTLTCTGGVSPVTEACNGLDDDCDGTADEGIPPAGSCGSTVGECRQGVLLCTGGSFVCTGGTVSVPELCDGRDNDCDGMTDEGNPEGGTACGSAVGACVAGAEQCIGGALVCRGAIGPVPETCNGRDDDCDGATDEGNPGGGGLCGTDVGACRTGTDQCVGGVLTCAGSIAPVAELCNSLDDDCDGSVDEGNPGGGASCGSNVGTCRAGTEQCVGGTLDCVGEIGPTTDLCDGLDNDCDGSIDEGNPGGGGSCGSSIGACRPGTLTCSSGSLRCTGGVSPAAETCNGIDDDCDGAVDEGVATMGPCGSGVGLCVQGLNTCVDGSYRCVGARGPVPELCDGLDTDCDGATAEGNPGGGVACGTATGTCARGISECVMGRLVCTGGVGPLPELCDGLDNDCDGLIDEGNPGGGAACGVTDVGVCEFGALACRMGALVCIGERGPSPEICDGLDNDCDGMIDEGDPEGGAACGDDTGECEPGLTHCVLGTLICDGAIGPVPEICDGLDNDCDGVADDGLLIGAPCGTDVGECSPGRNICRDGALVCEGAIDPIPELCDGLDNDCDGDVDEGLPLGAVCGSAVGECAEGALQCVSGRYVCIGEVPPSREVCDCLDNDCDGELDEPPTVGPLCPAGSTCIECQCALPCMMSEFGFTCPTGKAPVVDGDVCFCVAELCNADTCAGETVERDGAVLCAPDSTSVAHCTCKSNECTFPCDGVVCTEGTVCNPRDVGGRCTEDSCRTLGCGAGQICDTVTGNCIDNPCLDVTCAPAQACRLGVCETSCATVMCPAGQRCVHGSCAADPCDGVACAPGMTCDPSDGSCVEDRCLDILCPVGAVCDRVTGTCSLDPCTTLVCPGDEVCVDGECTPGMPPEVDAGPGTDAGPGRMDAGPTTAHGRRVLATGGGGCQCAAAGTPVGSAGAWLALGAILGLLFWRRGRRARGARQRKSAGLLSLLAALALGGTATGCDVDPFCLDCEEPGDIDAGPVADSGRDTGVHRDGGDDAGPVDAGPDGCVPGAPEECNGHDDNCDGVVDEGIDLTRDPENCGACREVCAPGHAFGECIDSACVVVSCDVGWHDIDMDPDNGCEYRCLATEVDDAICDLRDNDCDGDVDEDVDFANDSANCGMCGRVCRFAHSVSACTGASCAIGSCDVGFWDADLRVDNGCEYACTPADPAIETCNARDDDCDREIDEGDPGSGAACGMDVGECVAGIEHCVAGSIQCGGATVPATEACNGLDDDCDGMVDESNPDGGALCGTGVGTCDQGRMVCTGGGLVCTGGVGPEPELCDGLDNNCDGTIDDGDPEGGGTCGIDTGACSFGAQHCRGGVVVCEGDVGPVDEICNGVDDDCDGSTDEGNPGGGTPCGTDVGVCVPGTRQCTGGALICVGATLPGTETCNSLDDDCDSEVDEGNPGGGGTCGTDVGECSAGLEQCVGGTVRCIGAVGGSAEACDGLDNDCDGMADEGNPGGGAVCGSSIGPCRPGTLTCTGGTLTCTGGTGPTAETCNGLDDNCNGRVDEGVAPMGACGSAVGECSEGVRICTGGSFVCTGAVGPRTETCNGLDDDCDGMTDEGNPSGGGACGSSVGQCRTGLEQCTGGVITCVGATGPTLEICNSLDDNCNGTADEGNPGGGALCGTDTGECVSGRMQCVSGGLSCVGARGPVAEACDSLDNDCDGLTDEGNPGGGGTCGTATGECAFGTVTCVAGALTCSGGTGPATEVCNGLDDDCDGMTDEGNPGGGGICGTDVGDCAPGTRTCSGGTLICVGDVGPSTEVCDARDNDCDGLIDEGNPGGGATCGTNVGACAFGTQQCLGGTIQCSGGTGPTVETCNGLDDDCNGVVDNGFDLTRDVNNCGMCGRVCSFPFAIAGCSMSACTMTCLTGHWDIDGNPANGCEYACDFAGAEICNGRDDDCDRLTDELLTPPSNFCNANGVCAMTGAVCSGAGGWVCNYPPTYEPTETTCDSLDNDCDGMIDDPYPLVGTSCSNGELGACRRTGAYVCNMAGDGLSCTAPASGGGSAEVCNGLDDDCDGVLDDGAPDAWVSFTGSFGGGGSTRWIYAYEASHPDATGAAQGSMSHRSCSVAGRLPWTSATYPEAQAACAAIGARLCTETEWQRACQTSAGSACYWSYSSACRTYAPNTCNGNDYDFDTGTPGDQDGLLATGALPMCYANWGGTARIFDMSGNVEEWAQARSAGVNPIRGGSYNDTAGGMRCEFNFVVAGNSFRLPSVGFRCCRQTAP